MKDFAFGPSDVIEFRDGIVRHWGLWFDESRLEGLGQLLQRRLEASGLPCSVYLGRLERQELGPEGEALSAELTVGETYFFRHAEQMNAFSLKALPDRILARSRDKRLRILSAGCSTGEEPFSLSMLTRQAVPDGSWEVSILGVDLNPTSLQKARRGRFSEWALRETSEDLRYRWFRREGREWVLRPEVLESVQFRRVNLLEDPLGSEPFDIIFCRNVLMYFTPTAAREVVDRLSRQLVPGGYLFLGHAETLRGLSCDYHLVHTHETFYYQRRQGTERLQEVPVWESAAPAALPGVASGASWVDLIAESSQRVRALAVAPVVAPASRNLAEARELLLQERYQEALGAMPETDLGDRDALLMRAVLLVHAGQLAASEEACRQVLEVDDMQAGAHYVLALCREGVGDRTGALSHDQLAVYLDPHFAMPHLHLGLLARRAREVDMARRELSQALVLLEREDASRLLLFGGGFSRQALIDLCRSELSACGGAT